MTPRYLEDFAVGQTFRSGPLRIDTERIKTFAAEFDPQPFHLDEEAARDMIFRGLAASGWHTAAVTIADRSATTIGAEKGDESNKNGTHPLLPPISPAGDFHVSACYTHNYREFMGGFTDWVEQVADSKNARDYRRRVSDAESASMWQSLSYGANYKSAYCLAVCPAGEDVIGPFLADRKTHLTEIVRPLQEKAETIYVTKNSDAEASVAKRFPHKKIKHVGNSLRPNTIEVFLNGLPHVFQPGKSAGLHATFRFTFTGHEQRQATVVIKDQKLSVEEGHVGQPDLHVTADSQTWIGFLRKEKNVVWALLRRKIRLEGPLKLLVAFGKCFPQ